MEVETVGAGEGGGVVGTKDIVGGTDGDVLGRDVVGGEEGCVDGRDDATSVGRDEGLIVGSLVGSFVGFLVGGGWVGNLVGFGVGALDLVGPVVGTREMVGAGEKVGLVVCNKEFLPQPKGSNFP